MSRRRLTPLIFAFIGAGLLGYLNGGNLAWAQTFNSGSTGADGAFNPTSLTTLPLPADGIFNFTTVNISSNATVTFTPNAANTPVIMLATGDVTIAGTIDIRGLRPGQGGVPVTLRALGGPGGFPGGVCLVGGSGPGGGATGPTQADRNANYGAPTSFVSLIPLFGGSGGGGCAADPATFGGGGGGGGAIVIASSTQITITGSILANGGPPGFISGNNTILGGNGSGGAIRLVAPQVVGNGTLSAIGAGGTGTSTAQAGPGRIRIESFTVGFTGNSNPPASVSTAVGPVTGASTPALTNSPTLTFTSIGGVAGPANPAGSYSTADVSLPTDTTNPVPVVLTANYIPLGTVFTVKTIPQISTINTVATGPSSGSFESATATANVTLPRGEVSLLLAFASFTLPQLASLGPMFDGESIERVMVAAEYGGPSTLTLITPSGKELRPDQLPLADQLKLAAAFQAWQQER